MFYFFAFLAWQYFLTKRFAFDWLRSFFVRRERANSEIRSSFPLWKIVPFPYFSNCLLRVSALFQQIRKRWRWFHPSTQSFGILCNQGN